MPITNGFKVSWMLAAVAVVVQWKEKVVVPALLELVSKTATRHPINANG
jgi:hypothetical protein